MCKGMGEGCKGKEGGRGGRGGGKGGGRSSEARGSHFLFSYVCDSGGVRKKRTWGDEEKKGGEKKKKRRLVKTIDTQYNLPTLTLSVIITREREKPEGRSEKKERGGGKKKKELCGTNSFLNTVIRCSAQKRGEEVGAAKGEKRKKKKKVLER